MTPLAPPLANDGTGLPAAAPPAGEAPRVAGVAAIPEGADGASRADDGPAPIRLLLVEARPADAARVVELIGSRPRPAFEVRTAHDAAEALAELAEREFDVIVHAVGGAGGDGAAGDGASGDGSDAPVEAALAPLAAAAPRTPLVVLTDRDDEQLAARALRAGAQDHLWKDGMDGEQLARSLRYAIERQRVKNELEAVSEQLRAANARLTKLAQVDPLTDLLNRRGLEQVLAREVAWARRDGSDLVVFLIDLDDFKRVNDALGHAVGDAVLRRVGAALAESLRVTDHVARVGGDEFLVVLPRTRLAEGLAVAEKVRRAVAESLVTLGERAVGATASVGVVQVDHGAVTIDELLRRCHRELRAAKRHGKNRVAGDRDAQDGAHGRLVRAPIARLADGVAVAYELSAPGDGDERRVAAALASAARVPEPLAVHVDVAPATLADVALDVLLAPLGADFPPARLCIEVSDQRIIGEPAYLAPATRAVRARGVRLALDDVGFGRSSLESLMVLEPDVIKVDRRRVHGLAQCRDLRRSLARLVGIAASLGAIVVAQGVDRAADRDALLELGVELGQGGLFAAP